MGSNTKALINLAPAEQIEQAVLLIRGQRVMLDRDLAALYGVTTSNLNKAVKRNWERFPADFMFQLTLAEAKAVVGSRFQIGILKQGQNIKYLPYAFTQEGVGDAFQRVAQSARGAGQHRYHACVCAPARDAGFAQGPCPSGQGESQTQMKPAVFPSTIDSQP